MARQRGFEPFRWSGFDAATSTQELVMAGTGGSDTGGARLVYALVGLSALWQIMPFIKAMRIGQDRAEAAHSEVRTTR